MPHVVLADPNPEIAEHLATHLRVEGHTVELVAGGRALVGRLLETPAAAEPPALAAFALGLPDLHGFHVLRELVAAGAHRPDVRVGAVVTTECGDEAHRVRALRLGADDVLTRPFGVTEFVARVDAVLRRTLAPRGGPAPRGVPAWGATTRGGCGSATRWSTWPRARCGAAGPPSRSCPRSSTCSSHCSGVTARSPRARRSWPTYGGTTAP